MSNQWTVEAIEKKRWLAQQHHGREGELAALDKIEELLELQGELVDALENAVTDLECEFPQIRPQYHEALAKAKGETNEPV